MNAKELHALVPQRGRLEWIGVARAARGAIEAVTEAVVEPGTGIAGEHHARTGQGDRQVTLVQAEHLPVIAALSGRASVEPELLRRNLLVSGINLSSLDRRRFRIGAVLLEGTGECAPCSRLEQNLGAGGYQAARGHAGICARVLAGGTIRIGDEVRAVDP